jgi:hypothetical protein
MIRSRSSPLRPALLISACTLACCGGETAVSTAGPWRAVVDTIADTVTVRTLSGSVWGDTATLELEVAIGTLDGAEEYTFGQPQSIAVGRDGAIYVLDVQVPVLRSYDADGRHLRDLGREGRGPGEYEGPDGIAVLRDAPNSRITVYAPDGSWLEQWPHPGGFNTSRRHYVDVDGNNYAATILERGRPPWEWEFALVRRTPEGVVVDTLAAPTWAYDRAEVTASREGSSSVRRVPFTAEGVWTFSPRGYMVGGLTDDYRIDLYRPDAPVLRLERVWAPVPVAPEEADEQRRRITDGLRRQYGSWRWNGPPIPDTKPPFRSLFVSEEGDIWVLLSSEGVALIDEDEARELEERTGRVPARFQELPRLDVFSVDGRYLGPVKVPESFRVEPEPIVRGDHMWAVIRDELDLPRVARFRIVRPH